MCYVQWFIASKTDNQNSGSCGDNGGSGGGGGDGGGGGSGSGSYGDNRKIINNKFK